MGRLPFRHGFALLFLISFLPVKPARAEALSIEAAVAAAIANNERPQAASERANAAEARVQKARAFFFPTLGADATYTRRAFETVRNDGGTSVVLQKRDALTARTSASQTILDMRAFPIFSQSKSDRDASVLEAAEVRRTVAFEVASAFLRTVGLGQVRQAAERRLELSRQNLADATARFEAQIASSNDVTRAELEMATAEREVTRGKNLEYEATLNLGFLTGTTVDSLARPDAFLLDEVPEKQASLGELENAALSRRLDLAARQKRIEALHFFAKEPMQRYYPAFTLTGEYKYNNEAGFAGRNTTWALGVNAVWTFFDGLARHADERERLSQARAAQLERDQKVRSLEVEIKAALTAIEDARAAIRQSTVAQAAAKKNAAETTELYRNGLSTAFAVADSAQSLFEAEVTLVSERLNLALAVLSLRSALGFDPFGKDPK